MRFLVTFFIIFCFTSCFSTQYNAEENKGNFDKVLAGNKYTIFDKDNKKVSFTVTSVEKDSIRGSNKNTSIAIAKNDIKNIRKNNTAGTVLIVGGAVAGVTVITVGLINFTKDVSDAFVPNEY